MSATLRGSCRPTRIVARQEKSIHEHAEISDRSDRHARAVGLRTPERSPRRDHGGADSADGRRQICDGGHRRRQHPAGETKRSTQLCLPSTAHLGRLHDRDLCTAVPSLGQFRNDRGLDRRQGDVAGRQDHPLRHCCDQRRYRHRPRQAPRYDHQTESRRRRVRWHFDARRDRSRQRHGDTTEDRSAGRTDPRLPHRRCAGQTAAAGLQHQTAEDRRCRNAHGTAVRQRQAGQQRSRPTPA